MIGKRPVEQASMKMLCFVPRSFSKKAFSHTTTQGAIHDSIDIRPKGARCTAHEDCGSVTTCRGWRPASRPYLNVRVEFFPTVAAADLRTMNIDVTRASASTLQIGAVAERTGLSLRTLRHYDEVGLVSPSARTEGGFRLYTEDDIARLFIIRRMKPLGYTLDEMRDLLDLVDALTATPADVALRARYDDMREQAELRRGKLAEQLAMADDFVRQLDQL